MSLLIICLTIIAIAIMLRPETKTGCDPKIYAEFMSGKRGLGSGYDIEGKPIRNK